MRLVERDERLAVLHESFDLCAAGGSAVVVVSGPVACGKTRLLRAFADSLVRSGTLVSTLAQDNADQVALGADHVLQNRELADPAVESVLSALLALVYVDRLAQAESWCDKLIAECEVRGMVTLRAILTGVAADVALRRGNLPLARKHALSALSLIPTKSWGVAVGYPLGTLVLANTALRLFDEAAEQLGKPVPQEMFNTAFGLQYLHARGQHALATDRPHAALEDFRRCGRLMSDWNLDVPTLVPWRNGVGQAYLALGRIDEAKGMFERQLKRAGKAASAVRAVSLRLLAGCGAASNKLLVLQESVKLLERSGRLLDLATALAELSNEYRARGDAKRSRTTGRRAIQAAQLCDAESVARGLLLGGDRFDLTGLLSSTEQPHPELTDAEGHVARLAASGLTNREIGRTLYLSVSTVEQHLTRVFRKLNISRRTDLIGLLRPEQTDAVPAAIERQIS